jgi:formylglycine-generating enzyme required for sulfatase activity
MVMVYVPGGTFLMGSDDGYDDEQPVHSVTLDSFWIDRTEVSNDHYRQCVEAGECQAPTMCERGEPTYEDMSKTNHPVVCVDWGGAKAYCEWAGARLPTEVEWEYAARGEQGLVYPWGNGFDCSRSNFGEECEREYDKTAPVDSFESGASWCGALNMAGNVWEWVEDWYDGYPGTSYQSDDLGTQYKVLRGGSWLTLPYDRRAATRNAGTPGERGENVGLRCVFELEW